eukprot:m.23822 g.23822  ORF g.23822 m.23822 type:complete len:459 (-) comp12988_c0_seq3:670-2046(-)
MGGARGDARCTNTAKHSLGGYQQEENPRSVSYTVPPPRRSVLRGFVLSRVARPLEVLPDTRRELRVVCCQHRGIEMPRDVVLCALLEQRLKARHDVGMRRRDVGGLGRVAQEIVHARMRAVAHGTQPVDNGICTSGLRGVGLARLEARVSSGDLRVVFGVVVGLPGQRDELPPRLVGDDFDHGRLRHRRKRARWGRVGASEQRPHVDAVDGTHRPRHPHIVAWVDAGQRAERRIPVGHMNQLGTAWFATDGQRYESPCKKRCRPDPSLPGVMLVAAQRMVVPLCADPTVVGRKDKQRVVPHARRLQCLGHVVHARVQHLQHVAVDVVPHARIRMALPWRRRVVRRVHVLVRKIHEEPVGSRRRRVGSHRVDDVDGGRGVEVGRVVDLIHHVGARMVVVPHVVLWVLRLRSAVQAMVVRLGSAQVPHVGEKAAVDGEVVGGLVAKMALAHKVAMVSDRG